MEYPALRDIDKLAGLLRSFTAAYEGAENVYINVAEELLARFYFAARGQNDPESVKKQFQMLTQETLRNA